MCVEIEFRGQTSTRSAVLPSDLASTVSLHITVMTLKSSDIFQIHHQAATPAPLPAISPPTARDMSSTCALNYHTNRPWNCSVQGHPFSDPPSHWPEALKQMGGWLSLVWDHFSQQCLYELLFLCVYVAALWASKVILSDKKKKRKDLISTQKMFHFGGSPAT